MLQEEFSSVLLLPPCGKFEDQYIRFNAVDCSWMQKQERSKKIFLGCFLRGLWQRLPCAHPSSLRCTLSCCAAPALLQFLEVHQDTRTSPALDGTGLLQRPFLPSACVRGKLLYPQPLLLPVPPGSSLLRVYLQIRCGKAESCLS